MLFASVLRPSRAVVEPSSQQQQQQQQQSGIHTTNPEKPNHGEIKGERHDDSQVSSSSNSRCPSSMQKELAGTNDNAAPVRERISDARSTAQASAAVAQPSKRRMYSWMYMVRDFILDQWFLIALGILILIASQVQVPPSGQAVKTLVVTYLCVSIIFFVTGCTLPTKVLIDNYSRWKIHIFVQVQCFLMCSAVIFAIVSLCATNRNFMEPGLLVGYIFLGCVPTTISSNIVMTRQAHGNTALTVVESTVGNFLGPFIAPVLINMYTSTGAWYTSFVPTDSGGYGEIYRRVFKQLGLSIFLPMAIGQVVQYLFPNATRKVFGTYKLSKLSSVSLLVIIWQTFDQAFESGAFRTMKTSNALFIVFMSTAIFLIWLAVCILLSLPFLNSPARKKSSFLSRTGFKGLTKADIISIAYCVPAKTPAMGVPLSNVMYVGLSAYDRSQIQIPMVVFQGLQIAASSLLTIAFRKWIRPDEQLAKDAEALDVSGGDVSNETSKHLS